MLLGREMQQPLCAIRNFCSGITLPLLRLERKSLYLTMTNMNNNTFNVCQTEYGEQDSNLHEVSLITSLALRVYHSTISAFGNWK